MQDFNGQVMEEAILFHSRAVVWDTEARVEEWRGAGRTFSATGKRTLWSSLK